MASGLEFEGKNVEKAVQKACDTLHITVDELKYDVISYGSTGIFGLVGTKKARIRVLNAESETQEPSISEAPVSKNEKTNNEEVFPEALEPAVLSEPEQERTQKAQETLELPEAVKFGQQLLQGILDLITDDAKITIEKTNDRIHFNVEGGNAALLIGKRGQTLEAMQYLIDKVINKKSRERIRIQIDVEGYIENRRTNLEQLSSRLAEKAKRIGKPVTIGHMNSHDRRIVHLHLKSDNQVVTQSVGDGFYRKLVIFPKQRRKRR
jgi:spoIIIJ-associated protein